MEGDGSALFTLKALRRPYPAEVMETGEANPLVNSTKNEGPHLLDPVA